MTWQHPPGVAAWARYFLDAEAFDRTLPGRWGRDASWLPDPDARVLFRGRWTAATAACTANARDQLARVPEQFRGHLVLRDAALALVVRAFGRSTTREQAVAELAACGVHVEGE